jgi:hypothetical protein
VRSTVARLRGEQQEANGDNPPMEEEEEDGWAGGQGWAGGEEETEEEGEQHGEQGVVLQQANTQAAVAQEYCAFMGHAADQRWHSAGPGGCLMTYRETGAAVPISMGGHRCSTCGRGFHTMCAYEYTLQDSSNWCGCVVGQGGAAGEGPGGQQQQQGGGSGGPDDDDNPDFGVAAGTEVEKSSVVIWCQNNTKARVAARELVKAKTKAKAAARATSRAQVGATSAAAGSSSAAGSSGASSSAGVGSAAAGSSGASSSAGVGSVAAGSSGASSSAGAGSAAAAAGEEEEEGMDRESREAREAWAASARAEVDCMDDGDSAIGEGGACSAGAST